MKMLRYLYRACSYGRCIVQPMHFAMQPTRHI